MRLERIEQESGKVTVRQARLFSRRGEDGAFSLTAVCRQVFGHLAAGSPQKAAAAADDRGGRDDQSATDCSAPKIAPGRLFPESDA